MDQLSSPGGYLGGFLLAGIFLPIVVSFVADGAVMFFRGRGPTRLIISAVLTILIIGLYGIISQNTLDTGDLAAMSQAIGLIWFFSIPAAVLGFGVRMLALFLNPSSRALDYQAIEKRKERAAARAAARAGRGRRTQHA